MNEEIENVETQVSEQSNQELNAPVSFEQELVNRLNEKRAASTPAHEVAPEPTPEPAPVQELEPTPEPAPVIEPVPEAAVKTEQETPFYNDISRKVDEMLRNGIELNEKTFKYQSLDFDSLDIKGDVNLAMDLIEQELEDVQKLEPDEIARIMRKEFPLLYADIDEDDAEQVAERDGQILDAKIRAKKALPELKEFQKQILLPKVEQKSNEPSKEEIQARQQALENYRKDAGAAVSNFKGLELNLGNDVAIKVEANNNNMGYVKELVTNPEKQSSYFADNYLKDGKVDFDGLARDTFILKNFDAIIKEVGLQQRAIGKEEALKDTGITPRPSAARVPQGDRANLSAIEQFKLNAEKAYNR